MESVTKRKRRRSADVIASTSPSKTNVEATTMAQQDVSLVKQQKHCSINNPIVANPFLSSASLINDFEEDRVLQHVMTFTSSYSSSKLNNPVTETNEAFHESFLFLVDLLSTVSLDGINDTATRNFTPSDIVQLILPWCITQIQNLTTVLPQNHVVWRAVTVSISILQQQQQSNISASSVTHVLPRLLSQSLLFKLIPKVFRLATTAVDHNELKSDNSTETPIFAAYNALLQLYHPAIDVACRNILLPLREDIAASDPTNLDGLRILHTTLVWIQGIHASRKGNPKTTFQLLSDIDIFTALAQCYATFTLSIETNDFLSQGQAIVRDILWDGLFHPRHHMEGFVTLLNKEVSKERSTIINETIAANDSKLSLPSTTDVATGPALSSPSNTLLCPSTFKSYHGELLDAITGLLGDATSIQTPIYVILPILFRGFVQQSNEWDQNEKARLKGLPLRKRSDSTLSLIQNHIFVGWARPLLQFITTSSLASLRQMLQVVLEHNVYTPTQENNCDHQFVFLQYVVTQILDIAALNPTNQHMLLIPDAINCLQVLLQLNHLLLHDRMVDSISLCLLGVDGDHHLSYTTFLCIIVDTYQKLRQQRHIFHFIFGAAYIAMISNCVDKIDFLSLLIVNDRVASTMIDSLDVCPIVEVKDIFESSNCWIIKLCQSSNVTIESIISGLNVAVQLLTILTRNVRVDGGTAADIASCCQSLMLGSITVLADKSTSNGDFLSVGMTLAGLILDLHTRCVFWLGRNVSLSLPLEISARLGCMNTDELSNGHRKLLSESIVFLSCHRLKQLHSLIYDSERCDMEDQLSTGGATATLIDEAKRQAYSIAKRVGYAQLQPEYRWLAVSQNFSAWIAYADESHIVQFFKWVVLASAQSVELNSFSDMEHFGSLHTSKTIRSNWSVEEVETARCLISDASFFQHAEVDSRLALVGLSVAANCISEFLVLNKTHTQNKKCLRLILTPSKDYFFERSYKKKLLELMSSCGDASIQTGPDAVSLLRSTLCIIILVNSFPMLTCTEQDALMFLDQAIRIDHVSRSLSSDSLVGVVTAIVSAVRFLIVKVLKGTHASSLQSFLWDRSNLCGLVCGSMSTAISLFARSESLNMGEPKQLIDSTGQFVGLLLESMPIDEDMTNTLSAEFSGVKSSSKSTQAICALVSFSRRLLEGLQLAKLASDDSGTGNVSKNLTLIFEHIWDLAFVSNKSLPFVERLIFPQIPLENTAAMEGLLLLGDLLCTNGYSLRASSEALDEMQASCIESLGRSKNQLLAVPCWDATCYLTGRLAQKKSTIELTLAIVDALVNHLPMEYNTCTLEASFCHVIPKLEGDDLRVVLAKLTNEDLSLPSTALRLRLLKILFRYLVDNDQILVLSSFGQKIFLLALLPMRSKKGDPFWSENIIAAYKLLDDLLKRRDVISLKERDLALLLSYIVGFQGPVNSTMNRSYDNGISEQQESSLYAGTTEVFTAMFQRYTKQLYVCVPSVIALMHCLLRHAMYAPSSITEQSILLRGQHFTRICELLVGHRDIYKKHVIGLVLEFMTGLEKSQLSLPNKNALVPAIYFLLDTMSTFEMQQLNAHMNTTARILFRNIHQSHQKVHTYKGQ